MSRLPQLLLLALAAAAVASAQPTYSADVAKIMQEKCQRCHHPGDIAPFPLVNYDDAALWREDIGRVVKDKIMPPWKPVPGHGEFRDNFGLNDEERRTILDWVAAGGPQGDPELAPPPLEEKGEWELGEPDKILRMPEAFDVPRGKDMYRCFVLPTGLDADKFVQAVQVVPGNRNVVHHVILYLDSTGQAEKLDEAEPGQGYTCFGGPGIDIGSNPLAVLDLTSSLGGWVPGARTQLLPDNVGLYLAKDTRIVMQVHYFSGGRPGPDQTKIGLYYNKKPVQRRLRYLPVVNTSFKIPPGNKAYEVKASFTVPPFFDVEIVQIVPHMHLLGKDIKLDVVRRDKSVEDLIWIDNWDFNWQNFYMYQKAVPIQAGSTVRLTCTFDNSADNPKNPSNPLQTVGWGEGTQDEMCLGFVGVTINQENLLPASVRNAR